MKAQQEYESLTERIEAQKEKKMNRFIAALAAVIQESDEEPAKDTSSEEDDEDIVLISLFSLRIKTECELIREGSRDLVEQVKKTSKNWFCMCKALNMRVRSLKW